MMRAASPLRSTVIVSASRGLALVLSLALGVLSAAFFGTSAEKDAYLIAQAIPSLLTTIITGGIYAVLLMSLTEIGATQGRTAQLAQVRSSLGRLTLILMPLVVIAAVFPRPIIRLTAPGFGPEQLALSTYMLRITALTMTGAVYYAVFKCLFNSWQRFGYPGIVNLLVGLTSIVCLVVLVKRMGIVALAVGPLLGTFLALCVLAWLAYRFGKRATPHVNGPGLRDDHPREQHGFWVDFISMSIGANFAQVNLIVDNFFASYLPTGSITMLGFAFVIISNAGMLTTYSIAEVALPRLAAAARRGPEALGEMFRTNMRYMLIITAPLSAGAIVFGTPLVRLLFERGAFGPEATGGVVRVLACYSLHIVFAGYLALFWRVEVARKKFRILALGSLGAISLNAILDYCLVGPFGANGIALATTLVTGSYALALTPLIRRDVQSIHAREDRSLVLKVVAGLGVMSVVVLGWAAAYERVFDIAGEVSRLVEVGMGLLLGAGSYFSLLYLTGVRQVRDLGSRAIQAATAWSKGRSAGSGP